MKLGDRILTNFGDGPCTIIAIEKDDPEISEMDLGRYTIEAADGSRLYNAPGYLMKLEK